PRPAAGSDPGRQPTRTSAGGHGLLVTTQVHLPYQHPGRSQRERDPGKWLPDAIRRARLATNSLSSPNYRLPAGDPFGLPTGDSFGVAGRMLPCSTGRGRGSRRLAPVTTTRRPTPGYEVRRRGALQVLGWPAFDALPLDALVTTRHGGVSDGRYGSLNLGLHVGDEDGRVLENRERVAACLDAALD